MAVDAAVLEKLRALLGILEQSREAREAVRLTLELVERLPDGELAVRQTLPPE